MVYTQTSSKDTPPGPPGHTSKGHPMILTRNDFDEAVLAAKTAAEAYYDGTTISMTDAEYDTLVENIAAAIAEHPEWDDQGITTEVAAGASAGGDVRHPRPMLSLDKAKDKDEVVKFVNRANSHLNVEVKLDGMAIRAEYQNGNLVLAATRGDGATGEDVTKNVLRGINGLPATLNTPWTGEVRGEIYMTDEDFTEASRARVAAGKKAFVNPRNATAGSLRNADRDYDAPMSFAAYDADGDHLDEYESNAGRMAYLNDTVGIRTAASLTADFLGNTPSQARDVLDAIDAIEERRATLGYPIDGAVIKVDSMDDRARLGMGSRTPYWAVAYKYAADTAVSTLKAIEVAVGRTGRLSYTAIIEPTFVGGTTVTRASLHNAPWIMAEGLGIGSVVSVYRAGDVIPRVTAAMGDQPEGVTPYIPGDACPQCGETLDKSSLLWRCHTPSCSVVGRITYSASRDVWDIDGLGEEVATALVESGQVNTIADLFDLTVEDIAATKIGTTAAGAPRLIGTAVATKIATGIEAAKAQPLNRTITALGIRMTGRSVGRWLASAFKSMDALRAATLDEIAQIEKLGAVKAQHIVTGLAAMSDVIDRLAAHGVTMEVEEQAAPEGKDLPFVGKKVVVSGSVPGFNRTEAQDAAIRLGATVSGSVSKNTDLLVHGDGAGSKLAKAESLGVATMPAEDFAALYASIFG